MSDQTSPLGEQPAPTNGQTEAITDAGVQPQNVPPQDANQLLESATAEELASALGFDTDSQTAPEPPAAPPAPPEPGEQPPETPPAATEEETKTINRRRLSVTGLADDQRELLAKAIAMVRDGEAENPLAAMQILAGTTDGNPPPAADPPAAPASKTTELTERLADLREQRKQAKLDYDLAEDARLTDEIEDLQLEILRAEQAEESTRGAVADYQAENSAAVEEMETQYAHLLDDDNSPFADILDDKVAAAKARNDPALSDPRYILKFAEQVAAALGQAPNQQRAPIPPKPPRPVVGGAVAPSHTQTPQLTSRMAEDYIQKASPDELAAALWGS